MQDHVGGARGDERLRAAVAHVRGCRWDDALALCAAVHEESGGLGDAAAAAAYWAARASRRRDRLDEALQWLYRGLAAGGPDPLLDVRLRAELVHVTSNLGDNEDALVQADALLPAAARCGGPLALAVAHDAFAHVMWRTFDWRRGRIAFTTALGHARASGDVELVVTALMGLAAMQEDDADGGAGGPGTTESAAHAREALALQREAVRLAAGLGDSYVLAYGRLNEASILHSLADYEPAERILGMVLADPAAEVVHPTALLVLAQIRLDRADAAGALGVCEEALRRLDGGHRLYQQVCAEELLVGIHEALGDHRAALAAMRRYHDLYVRNATERAAGRAAAISARHDAERALAAAEAERERADRLERSNAALVEEAEVHARAAVLDGLTGVANRRGFDEALALLVRHPPDAAGCSVAVIDVDRFKDVNDTLGHLVGDDVLRRVAALVQRCSRPGDVVARYGGDEFVALVRLPAGDGPAFGERARRAVEEYDWRQVAPGLAVTVSVGVAGLDEVVTGPGDATPGALLALADGRLYAAKRAGRNQVVPAPSGTAPLTDPRGLPFP